VPRCIVTLLIPQINPVIRFSQNLEDEDFDTTPGAIVIIIVDQTDHGITLGKIHWQSGDTRLLVILIYTGKVLGALVMHFIMQDDTYNPDAQLISVDILVEIEELLNGSQHTPILRVHRIIW
jgi:hypothetical protein